MKPLALVVFLLALPAWADTSITALGSAPLSGGDALAARQRALDDSFRQAVEQSLAAFVDAPTRARLGDVVQKRILRRARSYVPQFKILSEGESEGVYHVQIEAQVADGRLRADVRALGVGGPATEPETPAAPSARRPRLAFLVRATGGDKVAATYGPAGELGPAIPPLVKEIEAQGFELVFAPGVAASGAAEGIPFDRGQAMAEAQKLGAGGAVTAAIQWKDAGRIRGTRWVGADATVSLRVDDVSGRVGEVAATGSGFGETLDQAVAAAVREASARIGRELGPRLAAHWPDEQPGKEGIDVHLRGASKWPEVESARKGLLGAPGVRRVIVAGLSRREVRLHVSGAVSAKGLADALAIDPRVLAKASGRDVTADIQPQTGMEAQ